MKIRSVYPVKTFPSLDEAKKHVRKIAGMSKYANAELEIHYNIKAKKLAPLGGPKSAGLSNFQIPPTADEENDADFKWVVVCCDSESMPGGAECAECGIVHFEDDYLCLTCREALG